MFNHEPEGYHCPFCAIIRGEERRHNNPEDIVYKDELVTAFVAPKWWEKNRGHVLIIPNAHHENIYDLPPQYGHKIHDAARLIAIALKKAYQCDGVSTRQHNEPAGNQDVWHYHLHVFPRYHNDRFYHSEPYHEYMSAAERAEFARKIREQIEIAVQEVDR